MLNSALKHVFHFNDAIRQKAGKRTICFLVANNWGSHIMCGHQVSEQLVRMDLPTQVLNIYTEPKKVKLIKDSIVVFVKESINDHIRIIKKLKSNGNILIWNPSDGFDEAIDDPGLQYLDGVVVPNTLCKKDWTPYFPKNCSVEVLYLQWDPRCRPHSANNFSLVYAGIRTPQNFDNIYLEHIPELQLIEINKPELEEKMGIFSNLVNYSCHFSVRKEGTAYFKYKPNAKLSIASASHANIILSRDQSNIELLDSRYPFYTSENLEDIKGKVALAKAAYGTPKWREGLDMLREVKERTSIERITKDFLNYLSNF